MNSEPTVPLRRPAADAFAGVEQVAVVVQVLGEPDVVVDAAVAILDDVDVAVMVDGEVVGIVQSRAHRQAGGQVDGVAVWRRRRSCCCFRSSR